MADPLETFISPEAAMDGGARLMITGTNFETRWNAIKARIVTLNDGKPWGNDEVGQEFVKVYQPAPDAEGGAGAVISGISDLAAVLKEIGPSVIHAVKGSLQTDDETGQGMKA